MKRSLKLQLAALCGLLLLQSSCTKVAITGRKQFNLVPNSVMNSMSFESYSEFLSQSELSDNVEQTKMVKRLGSRIQKAVEQYCAENNLSGRLKGYQWEFNLIEDKSSNAWCISGEKVGVHTGLLPVTRKKKPAWLS